MTIDPKITPDTRWTRINDNWETVACFRFTYADGKTVWADTLSEEQAAMMRATGDQIAEGLQEALAVARGEAEPYKLHASGLRLDR